MKKKTKKTKKTKKINKTKKIKLEPTSIRDIIQEQYPDVELLLMDPIEYDKAVLGVCEGFGGKCMIAYDYDKVIEVNVSMGMTYEEAVDFFEYNQIGAYVGEHTPVFINKIE